MTGRFLAKGERLICLPTMTAHYTPRNTIAGLWRQYLQYGEYREWTAVRHPHTTRRSHLFAPSLVVTCVIAVAAPAPVRSLARIGLSVYLVVVIAGSLTLARHPHERRDALLAPVTLAVMHLAHGTGAIRGAIRLRWTRVSRGVSKKVLFMVAVVVAGVGRPSRQQRRLSRGRRQARLCRRARGRVPIAPSQSPSPAGRDQLRARRGTGVCQRGGGARPLSIPT